MWDRVPDAENLTQLTKPELLLMLSEALDIQRDQLRRHAMVREAVHLWARHRPPLASRIYGALGKCWLFTDDTVDEAEAVRLSLDLPVTSPPRSWRTRWMPRRDISNATATVRRRLPGKHAPSMWRDPSGVRRRSVGSGACRRGHWYLGAVDEAVRLKTEAVQVGRQAGRLGEAMADAWDLSWLLLLAGRVEEAASLAREFLTDAHGTDSPVASHAAQCSRSC